MPSIPKLQKQYQLAKQGGKCIYCDTYIHNIDESRASYLDDASEPFPYISCITCCNIKTNIPFSKLSSARAYINSKREAQGLITPTQNKAWDWLFREG